MSLNCKWYDNENKLDGATMRTLETHRTSAACIEKLEWHLTNMLALNNYDNIHRGCMSMAAIFPKTFKGKW